MHSDFRSRSQRSLQLLEQTEGTGVNVYTHGEMLPRMATRSCVNSSIWSVTTAAVAESASGVRSFPWPHRDDLECIIDPTVGAYDDRIWTRSIVAGLACVIWTVMISLRLSPRPTDGRLPVQRNSAPYHRGFWRQTLLGAADTLIDLVSREKLVISSCLVAVTAHAASATTSRFRHQRAG